MKPVVSWVCLPPNSADFFSRMLSTVASTSSSVDEMWSSKSMAPDIGLLVLYSMSKAQIGLTSKESLSAFENVIYNVLGKHLLVSRTIFLGVSKYELRPPRPSIR